MATSSTETCPQVLSKGTCTDPRCTYIHIVPTCEPCGFVSTSAELYAAHIATKQHINRIQGESGALLRCPICSKNIPGFKNWAIHVKSARHCRVASQQGVSADIEPEQPDDVPGHTYCSACDRHIPTRSWDRHPQMSQHKAKEQYAAYKSVLEESENDKNGVVVGVSEFGIVEVADAKRGISVRSTIKTTIPSSSISLVKMKLASAAGAATSSAFSAKIVGSSRTLTYAKTITFELTVREEHIGRYEDRLEIIFEDLQLKKQFIITRTLHVTIGSKADHSLLKPIAPYKPRKRTNRQPEIEVVEGVLPPSLKAVPYVVPLPHAPIPRGLSETLSTGSTSEITGKIQRVHLPHNLDSETYGRHFKTLLWVEEFRMEHDLQMYDISNAKMTTYGGQYFLDVPGLAEKRPSVLVGDRMLVQKLGAVEGHWFEGGVHIVRKEEVGLRFNPAFRGWSKEQRYNIRFKLSRYPLRRQHQGMDSAFFPERLLFPLAKHLQTQKLIAPLQMINPNISSNAPQLQAVTCIVRQRPGSPPFIVFGPPGTGKTVTIVEAIRQVLRDSPTARIMACAPSNSAADLIASRLTSLGTDVLFRFYAPSRHKEQVPDDLLPFSYTKDGHFSVPLLARTKRFRVVVTTCVSASFAFGIGIPRGHFTHIFIDEAGQATEPEAMVGIKTIADNQTNIILSGDPKQLGPIIRSSIARELGLEISYIERLMNQTIYTGQSTSVVKLVKNYRSHNAILRFPNERFYGGQLQQCGDPKVINSYLNSSHVRSPMFPIVFHATSGKDDREASSPSFFNIDEVTQVRRYIQALRQDRSRRITDYDIGVITPYHAQCLKIRAGLRGIADGVKVGSVEEFQGQERRVIIISTVRSSREFVEYDLRHTLGFVANPRRFNVAVTRAQALLIVIGDPAVLSLDPLWRSFLNYIHLNGGWTGPRITWDPRAPVEDAGGYDRTARNAALGEMNAFTRRMERLTLTGVESAAIYEEADADDANVDRPWRDVE